MLRSDVADYVLPIPSSSLGAAEILSLLEIRPDIIHLDGAHDYQSVLADLRVWWPLLKPGGTLIGDDYPDFPTVVKAFDDFFGELGLVPIEASDSKCRVHKPM
jgi:hypothetical protein